MPGEIGMKRFVVLACSSIVFGSGPALAQERSPLPPENAMKLSQIIAAVEQRPDFRFVSEVDWEEEGYYEITYFTSDQAKVEIRIDPVTGKPLPQR
jgi:hypothetical protein